MKSGLKDQNKKNDENYSLSKASQTHPLLCNKYTVQYVDCVWNVTAHAQKPDFVFWRNGRVHLNRQGRPFIRLLAAEVCASAVVMLDTPCSKIVWRVLATHSIRQFPLKFLSRASPCAITFQLDSTKWLLIFWNILPSCKVSNILPGYPRLWNVLLVHTEVSNSFNVQFTHKKSKLYAILWFTHDFSQDSQTLMRYP